jgi:hypothetical protein
MKIVIGLFEPEDAIAAAYRLNDHGFGYDDLSLMTSASEMPESLEGKPEEGAASGAAVGAVTGGAIGALGTLVASTIPGLETMFVSGLMATAAGGVISAFLGSLYGVRAESQTKIDIKDELAAGKMLLVVKTNKNDAEAAESLLAECQGEHIETHTVPEE